MQLYSLPKINRVVPLNYIKVGTGQPLIILHGLFGSQRNWTKVCERLARVCSVYALDLRNHGDSPHSAEFDYAIMAADLDAFMDRMEIVEAIVLGHSLGGKVAMAFALAHSEKVRKLIVVDMAPRSYGEGQRSLINALVHLDLGAYTRQKDVNKALAASILSTELRYFLLTNLVRDKYSNFKWKINLEAISANYEKLQMGFPLKRVFKRPALFLKGEFSDFINAADLAMISKHFPLSVVKTVKGAGHWVHFDATETFTQMVGEFCRTG